jgi:hypothetical protein
LFFSSFSGRRSAILHSGAGLPSEFPSHFGSDLESPSGGDLLSGAVVSGGVSAAVLCPADAGALKEMHEMSAIAITARRI